MNQLVAQITTTLNVQSQPPPNLSDWALRNTVLNFIVDYGRPDPARVIFKTEIKLLDGTVVATTNVQTAPVYTINRGVTVYYSKDVMPLESMSFNGQYRSTLNRTGKLPSGQYQICVTILQSGTFQVLAAERCRNFNLTGFQLPFLMLPADKSVLPKLNAQTAIIFRWTPLVPQQAINPVSYRLQVFEILMQQEAVQALRANQPILDVSVRNATQYIWQPRLSFVNVDSTARYIWTIQTLDGNGLPILLSDGNGESRSAPFTFSIGATATKKN